MPVPVGVLFLLGVTGLGVAYLLTKPKPEAPSAPPPVTVEVVRETIVVKPKPPAFKPEPKAALLQKPESFVVFHMPYRHLDVFNAVC